MYTNFACVYGISSPMDGILQGDTYFVYRKDAAIIIFTGKDGVLFWFVLEDLGRAYPYADTPCYTSADVDVLCQSVASVRLSPTVRFKDVYANRSIAIKVPLEEGMARTWHTDRMVIVGDAAHKV
jgi:FAD dependent monooxygenase